MCIFSAIGWTATARVGKGALTLRENIHQKHKCQSRKEAVNQCICATNFAHANLDIYEYKQHPTRIHQQHQMTRYLQVASCKLRLWLQPFSIHRCTGDILVMYW